MKLNRREAQRMRATPLHQDRERPGAVNTPLPTAPEIPATAQHSQRSTATTGGWLKQWRDRCRQWLTQRSQPRIEAMKDAMGQTWWRAYNPRTQELAWLTSDTEVRLWLSSQPWL